MSCTFMRNIPALEQMTYRLMEYRLMELEDIVAERLCY